MFSIYRDTYQKAEDETFDNEQQAIEYALELLPSDDFIYLILDKDTEDFTAMVFQGKVWRPGRNEND